MNAFFLIVASTFLMSTNLFAFEQADLDNINSAEELSLEESFDLSGIDTQGFKEINKQLKQRSFVCVAKDQWAHKYFGQNFNKNHAKHIALKKCQLSKKHKHARGFNRCYISLCKRRHGRLSNLIKTIDSL